MKMLAEISPQMRSFLDERMNEDREDGTIAYRFSTHMLDDDDSSAMNFFDVREVDQSPRITYATRATMERREVYTGHRIDDPFKPGGHRTSAKPASVAQKVTGIENGRALDVFASAVHSFLLGVPDVVVVEGDEITRRYSAANHCVCVGLGDLGRSCMRYPEFSRFFRFYEHTAKMAAIVCAKCNGTRARAIIWEAENGERFLDRIYGGQTHVEQIRAWAKEQDIPYIWAGLGNGVPKKYGRIVVPVPDVTFDSAPYLDSLYYWCRTCKVLSNTPCTRDVLLGADAPRHEIVQLRGTQGTNHVGWWGFCPSCGGVYRDQTRTCRNSMRCLGCNEAYCADACPNGCISCAACRHVRRAGVDRCPGGCVECPTCHYVNRGTWLNANHGRCRSCGESLQESPAARRVEWTRTGFGWRWTCPDCGHTSRSMDRVPSPETGLVDCQRVHPNAGLPDWRHCEACHAHIDLVPPEVPEDAPSPEAELDIAYQKWSVRQARRWIEAQEGA